MSEQGHCCLCGSTDRVKRCGWCRHYLCRSHRSGWDVFDRGKAALAWHLFAKPPQHCEH